MFQSLCAAAHTETIAAHVTWVPLESRADLRPLLLDIALLCIGDPDLGAPSPQLTRQALSNSQNPWLPSCPRSLSIWPSSDSRRGAAAPRQLAMRCVGAQPAKGGPCSGSTQQRPSDPAAQAHLQIAWNTSYGTIWAVLTYKQGANFFFLCFACFEF